MGCRIIGRVDELAKERAKLDDKIGAGLEELGKWSNDPDANAKLLVKLTSDAVEVGLLALKFSTGELPEPCQADMGGSTPYQNPIISRQNSHTHNDPR